MRSAILDEDGNAVNVIVGSALGSVECPEYVNIDWRRENGEWVAPVIPEPEPEPIPNSISIRQLRIGLVSARWITRDQAVEWRRGNTLPKPIQNVISQMPEDQQFAAEETAFSMYQAERSNPLLLSAAQAAMPDATEKEINETLDKAFQDWSKL